MTPIIRLAESDDAEALRALYARYIDTDITFEMTLPDHREYLRRVEDTRREFPYLVCELDGRLIGYAYAHRIREREAYQWSAELSVYLDPDLTSRGLGHLLYGTLIRLLKLQNIRTVYGGITGGNQVSVRFHEKQGFSCLGCFHNIGYKNGRWLDVLWYEKQIADYDDPLPCVRFELLDQAEVQAILDEANAR